MFADRRVAAVCVALGVALAICGGTAQAADEGELDPLLRLLVEQGVITLEQAVAVQEQRDRELEETAAVPPPAPESTRTPDPKSAEPGPAWSDRIEIGGDVRMRYEGFSKSGAFDDGRRDRFRTRVRVGLEAAIVDWMTFGLELRNGDPDDPVSNNTSFDGAFSFKHLNLAEVFLDVDAGDRLSLIGGKFDPKSWWTVSDLQWDDDVTVEGVMENVRLLDSSGAFAGLELVGYQLILEESSSGDDAYTFGGQLRSDLRLGRSDTLGLGVGLDLWDEPQKVADRTLSGDLAGNRMTNLLDDDGRLVSDFEILNLFAEWRHSASERWPIRVNVFYYRNLGTEGIAEDEDTGYFGRVQVGDSKEPGRVALRYSYYYSEPDALFYVFTQSDTSRSSDVEAHRFDVRIGAVARSYVNLTWYNTRPVLQEDEPLDRWQVDYIVRF